MNCLNKRTNIALITAKGNNISISDKNLIEIAGKPAIAYPILAAKKAERIKELYVSTDCTRIAAVSQKLGCQIIKRPQHLCTVESSHGDTIVHGLEHIRRKYPNLNIITVLLGDTVMVSSSLIDLSIRVLEANCDYDSVMSVWLAQDDHPLRALAIGKCGNLVSYMNEPCGTSRQEYPQAFFYDQGVWTFRHEVAEKKEGPLPWWWMGKKVLPIVRNWVTGRDFHTLLDVEIAKWWVDSGKEDEIINMDFVKSVIEKSN